MRRATQVILHGLLMVFIFGHYSFGNKTRTSGESDFFRLFSFFDCLNQTEKYHIVKHPDTILNEQKKPNITDAMIHHMPSKPMCGNYASNKTNDLGNSPKTSSEVPWAPIRKKQTTNVDVAIRLRRETPEGIADPHSIPRMNSVDAKDRVTSQEALARSTNYQFILPWDKVRKEGKKEKLQDRANDFEYYNDDADDDDDDGDAKKDDSAESNTDLEELHDMLVNHLGRMSPGNLARLMNRLYHATNFEGSEIQPSR
ncbi:uncharacterized protein LOC111252232 isoform X1 [Varroa destructor]|uniref:Uncharacterized protein n=1 Tax=Varroa destructor TaxID=109461 RepID=A0A7M7KT46_VARDE|nr:uncharacterized protein LOC111252232 isoform X1 [Varroa destructor]XP_022665468.1 uncharacterized protein LOC111252232 isoform X1 [Varroa destructor]XP_022665469.1 uncharacterized protein LOC111252232 isoform X1 [Varroa destructor]XP_022665470.1 uncharacterized protein LOC111252232 isoform X1 [Varroa destructor]